MKEHKYLEAVHLSKHTVQQIENCIDFVQRSESALGVYKDGIISEATYLNETIQKSTKKVMVKAHAQLLMAEAEAETAERMEAIRERNEALAKSQQATQGRRVTTQVKMNSLYDLLYDESGRSKTQNLNQKVVINGPTLEILESKGNAVSFQAVAPEESQQIFDNLKWNRTLKIAEPVPSFQSVPATAHLFDLAGAEIQYDNLEAEAAQFQIK